MHNCIKLIWILYVQRIKDFIIKDKAMNSIIKLENIQKSYFMGKMELKVLKGISLEIF